jgi:hypothetical protein
MIAYQLSFETKEAELAFIGGLLAASWTAFERTWINPDSAEVFDHPDKLGIIQISDGKATFLMVEK